ncbi:gag-Pol polyprotein [Trichonephila clavipes]|nr:gag-Pol polyprotein [Trichonephila clavipes]
MCHLDFIAQYSTDIRHVQGNKNIVADALSRIKIDSITQSHMLNFRAFAEAQTIDSELQQFLHDSTSSLHLELKPCQISDHNLICDTSTGTPRPFVPTTFRKLIFEHLHNLSHPGIAATTKLICSRYVWPYARFSHIHIDIVGPLPPSDGFQYLLTMIDRFSRWPEAVPIPDTTAKTISRAIFHHWIARFDVLRLSQQIKAPRCDHRYLLNLHGFLEQIGLKQPHTILSPTVWSNVSIVI